MKRRVRAAGIAALLLTVPLAGTCGVASAQGAGGLANLVGDITSAGDIDSRQVQIGKRIDDALSSGRITKPEADEFLRELTRIAEVEAAFRASDNKLTMWESLRLVFDLDRVSRNLEMQLRDRQSTVSDIDARQTDLWKRISDGLAAGRLTQQESDDLKYEFDRIASMEERFRQSDAALTSAEMLTLSLDLDRLSSRLERQLHERRVELPAIDARQSELEKKLADGISSGKLTADESTQLKETLRRTVDRKERLRANGRVLTTEEALMIALDFERLNSQIDQQLNDLEIAITDLENKKAVLEKKLVDEMLSGKLTLGDVHEFKVQMDRVNQIERDFSASENSLNEVEKQTLAVEWELIANKVDRKIAGRVAPWLGLTSGKTDLQKKIDEAVQSQRLTAAEAQDLKSEIEKLTATENAARFTENKVTLTEGIGLVTDLERLNSRFGQTLHDRPTTTINVKGRQGEIDDLISGGITSGRLTIQEAKDLKAELDRINQLEATYKASDNELTYRESLALAVELERLAGRVEQEVRDSENSPFTLADRRAAIDRTIFDGIASGRLTEEEAASARTERDRLNSLECDYRTDSRLTTDESLLLATEFERLANQVQRQMRDRQIDLPDIDSRQKELARRVSEGLSKGRLSEADANELQGEFDRIQKLEDEYRASGGLSYGEEMSLTLELERLSRAIEQKIRNRQVAMPDINSNQASLDRMLADAVASGRMKLPDAERFKVDLERIAAMESGYRYSGGGLSYPEGVMLVNELTKIEQRIKDALKNEKPIWVGIYGRRAELAKRVDDALAAKKVSLSQSNAVKAELGRIASAEQAFAASGGGLDFAETVSLVRDLERLNGQLEHSLGMVTKVPWDDIDARQAQLDKRIARAIQRGKLKKNEALKIRKELQRIASAEAVFRSSGNELDYWEKVAIANDLDKLGKFVSIYIRD